MTKKAKKLEFTSLNDVTAHLDRLAKDIAQDVSKYRSQIQELSGHNPDKPVTAIDVIKIVQKVFFKEQENA
tara:strand:- start:113 stop:325 length:213 start_codon:yes stop_codon:yes gene_type:complete